MTKVDLIEEVFRVEGMTRKRKESAVIVETILECIIEAVRAAEKIEIRGFGSFRTRQRMARVGRNARTGVRVEVPARKVPYFKPSKGLLHLINGGSTEMKPAGKRTPLKYSAHTADATREVVQNSDR